MVRFFSYDLLIITLILTADLGDVVRISPNEVGARFHRSRLTCSCLVFPSRQLHFANPAAYNEIYNAQNKWDKDHDLYRAFDMGESFFVQTRYLESKHSRALVSNFFSKKSISELQHLIRSLVRVHFLFLMGQVSHSLSS